MSGVAGINSDHTHFYYVLGEFHENLSYEH